MQNKSLYALMHYVEPIEYFFPRWEVYVRVSVLAGKPVILARPFESTVYDSREEWERKAELKPDGYRTPKHTAGINNQARAVLRCLDSSQVAAWFDNEVTPWLKEERTKYLMHDLEQTIDHLMALKLELKHLQGG